MATFTWLGGSGNWTDSNWSISGPSANDSPDSADIAIISAPGTYTLSTTAVTSAHDVTVNNSNATLQLSEIMGVGGTFAIDSGTLSFATLDNFLFVPSLTNNGTILSTNLGAGNQEIGAALTNNGVVSVDGDTFSIITSSGNFLNTGTIGVTDFGSLSIIPGATFDNSGLLTLSNGGTLTLEAVPSGPTTGEITFLDGSAAKLSLDLTFTLPTTVDDFQPGNIIDLTNTLAFDASETAALDADAITVFDHGTVVVTIPATGTPLSNSISVSNNGSGYAELTTALACFAAGTRIGAIAGPARVEALNIGDHVGATFAGQAPIEWIGHRRVDCRRHPQPEAVWPVRIAAHAFGTDQPSCDLWLSPDHAVYVNGVLIPVKYLVNGSTITQIAVDAIVYYHVALPRHDVLLAEGLAVESYLDADDRFQFSNRDTVVRLHPNFSRVPSSLKWEAEGCAPLVVVGREVDAVRQMLRERESLVLRSAGRRRAGL